MAQGQAPLGDAGGWGEEREADSSPLRAPALTLVYIKEEASGMELVGVNELGKLLWLMVWHLLKPLFIEHLLCGRLCVEFFRASSFLFSTVLGIESCCFPFAGKAQSNEVNSPRSLRDRKAKFI